MSKLRPNNARRRLAAVVCRYVRLGGMLVLM